MNVFLIKGRETWYFCAHMVWFILPKESEFCIISQDLTDIRNPEETLQVGLGANSYET